MTERLPIKPTDPASRDPSRQDKAGARATDLCDRCYRQSAADMGFGIPAAG
jgi:hypothetical protein